LNSIDMGLPRHRPFRTARAAFEIGLKPMPLEAWLETGPDHAVFMAAKRARLEGLPPLFYGALASSRPAQAELLALVTAYLVEQHGGAFTVEQGWLHDHIDGTRHELSHTEPLETLGRILEEDFILIDKVDGADIITAASNAYTTSGRIVSSVGRSMRFAHEFVPGLNDQLGARIDRVLANVQATGPVVRFNWVLTSIADRLFPEGSHDANVAASARTAAALEEDFRRTGDCLWIRAERQTFVRLPETKALAFGIHTYSHPLSSLHDDAESLGALHRVIGEYAEDRLRYSAMLAIKAPIMRWLEYRLALAT
jgi:dimethylamine monooxygenase subunit A